MYNTAEKRAINAAWYAVENFLDNRDHSLLFQLRDCVKGERNSSKGGYGLEPWSLQECRLYVLREFLDGIRKADTLVKAADFAGVRPSLLVAFFVGANVFGKYDNRSHEAIEALLSKIDTAAVCHDTALQRFLDRNRAA